MRSLFRILTVAILGLTLTAGSARASQVVFGNLGSDGSEGLDTSRTSVTATTWLAQGFTTGVGSTDLFVDSIVLGLSPTAGSVSTTISIWSGTGASPGIPDSLLYTSSSASVSSLNSKYTFSFSGAALSANTSYWVVLQQDGVDWNQNGDLDTPQEQNSSGYSYLTSRRTQNSGSTWGNAPSQNYAISITASSTGPAPIPEPGTWAAAALLIGAAAYVRLRRRAQAA